MVACAICWWGRLALQNHAPGLLLSPCGYFSKRLLIASTNSHAHSSPHSKTACRPAANLRLIFLQEVYISSCKAGFRLLLSKYYIPWSPHSVSYSSPLPWGRQVIWYSSGTINTPGWPFLTLQELNLRCGMPTFGGVSEVTILKNILWHGNYAWQWEPCTNCTKYNHILLLQTTHVWCNSNEENIQRICWWSFPQAKFPNINKHKMASYTDQ